MPAFMHIDGIRLKIKQISFPVKICRLKNKVIFQAANFFAYFHPYHFNPLDGVRVVLQILNAMCKLSGSLF